MSSSLLCSSKSFSTVVVFHICTHFSYVVDQNDIFLENNHIIFFLVKLENASVFGKKLYSFDHTSTHATPFKTLFCCPVEPFTTVNFLFLPVEVGVSQSQESCGLDSVCLNGGYTPNTFTLHGLGAMPGSRAGVVGSTDLLKDGGVGMGGDDISPALLTPHGAADLGTGAAMRRNLSDAAALEKMIISELVQSNLRPSGDMPVPPERYGSLARPHHLDRAALAHTATLTRHAQQPQEGWAATMQPTSRHNAHTILPKL